MLSLAQFGPGQDNSTAAVQQPPPQPSNPKPQTRLRPSRKHFSTTAPSGGRRERAVGDASLHACRQTHTRSSAAGQTGLEPPEEGQRQLGGGEASPMHMWNGVCFTRRTPQTGQPGACTWRGRPSPPRASVAPLWRPGWPRGCVVSGRGTHSAKRKQHSSGFLKFELEALGGPLI